MLGVLRKPLPRCDVGSDRLQLVAHGMSAGLDVCAASRTEDTKKTAHLVDAKFCGLESSSSGLSAVIDPGVLPKEPLWMRSEREAWSFRAGDTGIFSRLLGTTRLKVGCSMPQIPASLKLGAGFQCP